MVGRIFGHFLISGFGQNCTKNRISQPAIDWSVSAFSSPIESVTGGYYCALSTTAPW